MRQGKVVTTGLTTPMPRVLREFLHNLKGQYSTGVSDWIMQNNFADNEMLEVLHNGRKMYELSLLRSKKKYSTRSELQARAMVAAEARAERCLSPGYGS